MSGYSPGQLAPRSQPAPVRRRVLAQARLDTALLLRNGEQLLLAMVLPVLLLVGLVLSGVPALQGVGAPRVDVLVPGTLALAVVSTAFTGQAIATGFDRRYGVLRLLGTTPLGRSGLVAGRLLAVLAVETVQVAVLAAVGLALGWRPATGAVALLAAGAALLLGTAAFVALGLLLAGTLRAEAVLAGANLVWVLLVLAGGLLVPAGELPGGLSTLAPLLPSGALGDALRAALVDGRVAEASFLVLAGWAAGAAALTARTFRWD